MLPAGDEFQIDLPAGVKADPLHLEDPVDGRLMCFHGGTIADFPDIVKETNSIRNHTYFLFGVI